MGYFTKDIGIDLGTANTLVYAKNQGVVVREPSVVAINRNTNEILAVGEEAKKMIGRTPDNIMAIRPMKDGVIADIEVTEAMMSYFISKINGKSIFRSKPRVVICVPSGVTEVEKRAVEDAAYKSGAKEVYLVEEPMAAAFGSNLPIEEPTGSMVIDIGGGTTDIAVISLGGIVSRRSLRVAGDTMDKSIVQYIKKEYNLLIGERTAENIKTSIGRVYFEEDTENETMDIKGRDLITGLPKNLMVTSKEIGDALKDSVSGIVEAIKIALEHTPPELSSDVMEKGILLTGGGALLKGLDKLISTETGIDVVIADEPLDSVAIGTSKLLDNLDLLKKIKMSSSR